MSSGQPFSLSTNHLDFGQVPPGTQPTQQLVLTNRSGGNFQFQVLMDQAWATVQFGTQQGDDLAILVRVDPSKTLQRGRQTARLEVQALGVSQYVTVTATFGAAAGPVPQPAPTYAPAPQPASPAAPRPASPAGPASSPSGAIPGGGTTVSLPPSLSLPLAVLLLSGLFGGMHALAAAALQGVEGGEQQAALITAGFAAVYSLLVFGRVLLLPGTRLPPASAHPDHHRLFQALTAVCQQAGIQVPRVVLRPAPSPNVCCHGLYRGWCTLQVHQGLLDTLTDADELQAALAHEIVHVKRFDTLFFTCLRPLLWISRVILGLLRILTLLLGRGVRQGGLPRINLLGPLQKMLFGGIEGMIMVLAGMMMLAMLAALAMFFLTYALLLVGCLVAFSLAGLAYCRHLERTADLAAAQLLGDGDAMLLSLARCGHAIGSERGQLDLFASLHLGGGNYSLLDILRCLKAGGDPAAGVDWKLRLFRSHPLLLERLSQIMRAYGTSLV